MTLEVALTLCAFLLTIPSLYFIQVYIKRRTFEKSIRVKFRSSTYFDDGILLDYSDSQSLSYYLENDLIIKSANSIYIEIENPSEIGLVKIAPYIFIRLRQRFKLPENLIYYCEPKDGIGGGGNDSIYYDGLLYEDSRGVSIAPAFGETFGVYGFMIGQFEMAEIPSRTSRDFYSVTANDTIELVLTIAAQPGFYFRFDIGIPVSINGKERMIWSDTEYTCATPTSGRRVKPSGIIQEDPNYDYGRMPTNFPDVLLEDWINQNFYVNPDFNISKAKQFDIASRKLIRPLFPTAESVDIKDGGFKNLLSRMTTL